jgi:RNA polymerase sigma-70 factor (ECF subfamily)
MPDEPEAIGLLALMLLHDSRRLARTGPGGELILLEDQDRSLWNRAGIAEGLALTGAAMRAARVGPYALQAAIAAVHARAETAESTDWHEAVELYSFLLVSNPSPVVRLNRAAAIGIAQGPAAGLAELDEPALAEPLARYHLYHAARADFLRRLERWTEAGEAYSRALEFATNPAEQTFLAGRLRDVQRRQSATG